MISYKVILGWDTVLKSNLTLLIFIIISSSQLFAQSDFPVTKWHIEQESLLEVVTLFNKARAKEKLAPLKLPTQNWNQKNDAQKMFYLINEERTVRGISPLRGISNTLMSISQKYANSIISNAKVAHRSQGGNSWSRITSHPKIGACYDRIDYAENLSWFKSNKGYQPFYIERSVFSWMYHDDAHHWRHRYMLLYNDFSFGSRTNEGLIGVGVASGSFGNYPYNTLVVLNLFDPCKQWRQNQGDYYE